jgi:NAD(P)-dependent dehydrogenase (short-subunit alcohol dehydrogenase family)
MEMLKSQKTENEIEIAKDIDSRSQCDESGSENSSAGHNDSYGKNEGISMIQSEVREMNVNGKVAIVTGSGSGIGEGIAMKLGEKGATVIINDIDATKAENVVGNIRKAGGKAFFKIADVTKSKQVEAMAEKVFDEFGRIDILVNNTGIVRDNLIVNMPEEDWDLVMDINLKGAWITSKYILPKMKEKGYGRVVNISSRAWLGQVGQSNYSASKGGLVSLTRALALEFAKYGITVNCVAPGLIDTPLIRGLRQDVQERLIKAQPTPIIGQPDDVANTVYFLTSEEARYITGQVLHVDGGKSLGARNI